MKLSVFQESFWARMLALFVLVATVSAITAWLTTTRQQHLTFVLLAAHYAGVVMFIATPGFIIGAIWGWLSYSWQRFIWPCITVTFLFAALVVWTAGAAEKPDLGLVAGIIAVPLACALAWKWVVMPLHGGPSSTTGR